MLFNSGYLTKKTGIMIRTVLLSVILACSIQGYGQSAAGLKTVTIDKQSFGGGYPAVLLDVKTGKITKLAKDFREEDLSGDADLWIEPQDPEINCLERTEDSKLKGLSPHLLVAEQAFEAMDEKSIPKQIGQEALRKEQIVAGTAFWVQASNNSVYKVKIDKAGQDPEILVLTIGLVRR